MSSLEVVAAVGIIGAAVLTVAGVAALLWRSFRYAVRTHDELLGNNGRPGVRQVIEDHMKTEDNTIAALRKDMDLRNAERDRQWDWLRATIGEIKDALRRR